MPNLILAISNTFIIALVIIFVVGIYLGICYYIYKKIMVDYNNPPVDLVNHEEEFYKDSYEWFQEIPKEDIYVTSYDELKLHGYYIPSYDKKSKNLVIISHGYQSKATDMIIIAKMYCEMGFQAIIIDQRGHGDSDGNYTTLGHYEKYDLKKWIQFALRTYGNDMHLLLHGVSMGAATTMMVTALDIPKDKVKFMLLDSGFTVLGKTLTNTKRSKGLKVFYPGLNLITYIQHKFIFWNVRPIKVMKKNTIPFLIVQGDKDTAVSIPMAKKLYNGSPTIKKELLIIEDSYHALGFRVDYQRCYDTLYENIKDIFHIKKKYESKK